MSAKYCKERIYAQNIENWGVTGVEFDAWSSGEECLGEDLPEKHTTTSLWGGCKVRCHMSGVEKH